MAKTTSKPNKKTSITDLDDEGLVARLAEQKQELFNLRFQNVTDRKSVV